MRLRPSQAAFIIAVLSVLLRGAMLLHHYTPEKGMLPDSRGYEGPAQSFLRTGSFVESLDFQAFLADLYGSAPSPTVRPLFLRTPGYPLFIATAYRTGAGRRGMLLLQILLSGLAVWLTFLLGRAVFSAWAGVLAAFLIAVDPATIWCSQLVLSDSLFAVVLLAAALAAIAVIRRPDGRTAFAAGVLFGLAILVKPVVYYFPIVLCGVLWWGRVPKRFIAALLIPIAVLAGGWQIRNWRSVGSGMISGAQSTDLFLWRAAGVVARRDSIDLESAQRRVIRTIPDPASLTPAELDGAFFRAGGAVIRAHPILYLQDTAKGLLVLLISPGARSFPAFFGLPATPFIVAYVLFLLAIYGGILVQAVRMWGRKPSAIPILVAVLAAYLLAVHAGADSSCRYRVPAMPFLAVCGAAGMLLRRPIDSHQPGNAGGDFK